MTKEQRPYDVIIWGATGFTGQLLAEYLAKKYGIGGDLRWAIAGRSREKLEQVRTRLLPLAPKAGELPILVGDASDPQSLAPIVAAARVVASTVGPYAIHGHGLTAACAASGTDYCDLTGEVQFVRRTIEQHHRRARETGARLVHCCGFDSIPSDLGVLLLQTEMMARQQAPCAEIALVLMEVRGGVSGGTAASVLQIVEEASQDPVVRRALLDPYSLDPDRGAPGPDGPDQLGVRWDADLGVWTGPFLMAAINARIVRRSNALLGYRYGRDFRYGESQSGGPGGLGFLTATGLSVGVPALFSAALFPPTRALLRRLLPSPGEGPSVATREGGGFLIKLVGRAGTTLLVASVRGHSDPGYGETAKMLGESAVCLALDTPISGGGVLTPASAMGLPLIDRLRAVGMEFSVTEMGPA